MIETPNFKPGEKNQEITADKLTILHYLGCGAGGKVYLVEHKDDPEYKMALKQVTVLDEKEKNMLGIEQNTLTAADNDNIVRCFGAYYEKVIFTKTKNRDL